MIDKVKEIVTGTSIYKVTPKGDLSWYIKWVSSIFVLSGMLFTSLDIYPWNLWGHLFGVFGWFIVGMLWHDRALIVLNSIAVFLFITGLFKYYEIWYYIN